MAVTAVAAGIDAVEKVHAPVHALQNIGRRAHAHQVDRLILGKIGHHGAEHAVHLLVALSHRQPADRVAVQIKLGDLFGVLDADIVVDGALVDPEEQLVAVDRPLGLLKLPHFLLAADEPAGRAVHGRLHIAALCQGGRTFVKRHRDGGRQVRLDLHALLRAHEDLMTVDVGAEGHALLADLTQAL